MQHFSIKAMERLSGIKAHTLRVWEQRYGILKPSRQSGKHRFYSNTELKTLLRVACLSERGYRIGEISRLSSNEMVSMLEKEPPKGLAIREDYLAMMEAVIDFDEDAMDTLFNRMTRQYGFSGAVLEVFFPLLSAVGQLWVTDRIFPGQEHFASNFIVRKIINATNQIEKGLPLKPGLVMLFTPEGEFHEIGLLMMNYLLRINGFKTIYVGVNTGLDTLDLIFQKNHPTHLLTYLTSNLQYEEPQLYLSMLTARYPQVQVVAAGKVTLALPEIAGCMLLRRDVEMIKFSRNIF